MIATYDCGCLHWKAKKRPAIIRLVSTAQKFAFGCFDMHPAFSMNQGIPAPARSTLHLFTCSLVISVTLAKYLSPFVSLDPVVDLEIF